MFDAKCLQLAKAFLEDFEEIQTEDNANKLAQEIQTTVEDWILDARVNREINTK